MKRIKIATWMMLLTLASFSGLSSNTYARDFWRSPYPVWDTVDPSDPFRHDLKFDISASFYINADLGRKIINLTPFSTNASSVGPAAGEFASLSAAYSPEILDQYVNGFRVIDTLAVDVSGSVIGGWWYTDEPASTLMPYVGIVPMKSNRIIVDRFAANRAEIEALAKPVVPFETNKLSSWAPHDSLTYISTGGVLFMLGIGAEGFGFGANYLAQGSWVVYVQKLDNNKVFLKITKGELRSLTTSVGTVVVNAGVTDFKSSDEGFSFIYDLNSTEAAHAYEDAVKGNLLLSQKMAQARASGVTIDTSFRVGRVGKTSYFWFGIPFIASLSASGGTIQVVEHSVYHANKAQEDVNYGVYTDEKFTRFLVHHSDRLQTFYTTAYRYQDAEGRVANGFYGNFLWSYENDKASSGSFGQALRELKAATGMQPTFPFAMPRGERLGYLGVKLKLNIMGAATAALIEKGLRPETSKELEKAVNAAVDAYFANNRDPESLCRALVGVDNPYHCAEAYRNDALDAVESMKGALVQMDQTKKALDRAGFAKAYAELGRLALRSQFSFQALLCLVKGTGAELETVVEGERVSNYKVKSPLN